MVKAKIDHFKNKVGPVLQRYFPLKADKEESGNKEEENKGDQVQEVIEKQTWSLEFKKKNNENIQKQPILDELYEGIDRSYYKIEMREPNDLTVICEIVKDLMIFAVAPKFKQFKKYNLREICGVGYRGEQKKKEPVQVKSVVLNDDGN
jgi:hypothetical protein